MLESLEVAREALTKINAIRNSIIGLQTINWSEHIYPLVAALDAAGMEGMGYPEARENFGTMLERTNAAEAALAEAEARGHARGLEEAAKVCGDEANALEKAMQEEWGLPCVSDESRRIRRLRNAIQALATTPSETGESA